MKKFIIVVILIALLQQLSYAQDTLKHITSGCIGHIIATESDSCPEGIHFRYFEDTLEIYGTIWANCCGVHFVEIIRSNDSIFVTSFDTGMQCTCSCLFCFDIKLPASVSDSIVVINGDVYNSRKTNSIEKQPVLEEQIRIYPVPAEDYLYIEVPSHIRINKIDISDITGRWVNSFCKSINEINISNLETGTYFMSFELKNQQHVTKIIIKK